MISIGEKIKFIDSKKGTVIGVLVDKKKGGMLLNLKTGEVDKDTWKLKIKPSDGSRAFWTPSMKIAPQEIVETAITDNQHRKGRNLRL